MRRFLTVVLLAFGCLGAAPAPSGAPKPLTFEALRQLVSVRDAQIAPDGSRVVYVRSVGDYKADRNLTELVLVNVADGTRRILTHDRDGVHEPRWSPSGDRLAYLASPERDKPAQLYVMPMNGGDSERITDAKTGVDTFAWRPDGAAFAYASEDEAPKPKPDGYVEAFRVTDEDYLTREASRATHLWTIGADRKGATQLTHGPASVSAEDAALHWMPDGKRLLLAMQPDGVFAHFTQERATFIDASTGAQTPLDLEGPNAAPLPSHDGHLVAIALPRHKTVYLQSDVSIRDVNDGREVRSGMALDRNVHWAGWSPRDDAVYVATADGVRDVVWRLPLAAGTPQQLDLGDVDFAPGASIARDGTLAFVGLRRDDPSELYVLSPKATRPRRLTNENGFLDGYALAKRDRFDWTSDDGLKMNGVLTYPVGYQPGKQYPLVLDVHGGPVSTSTWDLAGVEATLDEVLATDGYFVLQPNYRGSDNSGDAFLTAIVPHVTSGPGRDNLAAVAALEKTGMIDPARIGVSGWSGGGLQTSWLVGHAAYWRAAVAGAGVYDWFEQAVLADINEDFARTFLGGATPWTNDGRALYREESPLTYADAIRTPLLILSDMGDQRVPVAQSFALYRALHDRGKTVSFVAFPRKGHFPTDPVGRESVLKRWAGWFERWMK